MKMDRDIAHQDVKPAIISSSTAQVAPDGAPLLTIAQAIDTPRHAYVPRPPLSPFTHILIFGSVLVPVALLPYLAVRRSLLSLHRKVGELSAANAALQRDLKTTLLEAMVRREEHNRLRSLIEETRREVEKMRADATQRELVRATTDERVRRDIQELLVERQKTRAGLSTVRDLGSSLADIAAFMHEVEVQQGFVSRKNDGRGIERIRQLAYKLQGLPVDNEPSADIPPASENEAHGKKPAAPSDAAGRQD